MQNPPPTQPDYGNQYDAPLTPPLSNAVADDTRAKTALGLEANLGAAIGYPVGVLAIIMFFMEKENRFARFHALQSILYSAVAVVVFVALIIVWLVLSLLLSLVSSALATVVGILMGLVLVGIGLAYLGGLVFCALKAYGGNSFKLPVVGNMAEKIANK
jgi:uncharacterized membrane protein